MQIYRRKHPNSSEPLHCSFCGKDQFEVKCLIAGPAVYICDDCIDICNEIIAERRADPQSNVAAKGDMVIERARHCSFCGKRLADSQMIAIPERGQLCPVCVKATRSALGIDR